MLLIKDTVINMRNKGKIIFINLTLVWRITIFSFSSRNGELSTGDSHLVGVLIGRLVVPRFDECNQERQI